MISYESSAASFVVEVDGYWIISFVLEWQETYAVHRDGAESKQDVDEMHLEK